jgi:uncharacterized membrane protein
MAGIGFELRKLSRRDDLLGVLTAYSHSSIAASGPWLFTVLCIAGISLWGGQLVSLPHLTLFRLIIIYNFAFSLVLSAPITLLATRFLADAVYESDVREAPGMLLGALITLFAITSVFAVPFYLIYVDVAPITRLAALVNFFLVTGIWIASIFLTALKDYRAVSRSFGYGMVIAFASTLFAARAESVAAMLVAFNGGLAFIVFSLVTRIFAEYPYPVRAPFSFLRCARRYWEVGLGGLLYSAAIWVDKWILWFAPEAERLPSGLVSNPDYDSATFLAYLTIVPSMAAFVLTIETRFFERYLRFYRDISRHATFSEIERNHEHLLRELVESLRNLVILQGAFSYSVILLAPKLLDWLRINFLQLGMFRLAVCGALFHVLFLFMSILLSYFDLRRDAIRLNLLFFTTNAAFTLVTLVLGFRFYGYGYFLSSLVTATVAFVVLTQHLRDLPYQTFVVNNESVQGQN